MTTMSVSSGMSSTSHQCKKHDTMVNIQTALPARCTVPVVLRHEMKIELQNCGAVVKSSQNAYSFEYAKRVRAKQIRNLAQI